MRSIFNNEINLVTPDDVAAERPHLHIIDRRLNGKNKSIGNRERFQRRNEKHYQDALKREVKKTNIKDFGKKDAEIRIPKRDLQEPTFGHGSGGNREYVHPGNKDFVKGDKIKRPEGGGGGGSSGGQASDSGEGEDDFIFTLKKEDLMKYFFKDLALPNLLQTIMSEAKKTKPKTAGFRTSGNPEALSIIRTGRQALARRIALGAGPSEARKKMIEEEIDRLTGLFNDLGESDKLSSRGLKYVEEIELRSRILAKEGRHVPFLDPIDLRYRGRTQIPVPESKAVMFCLMDVSGSMDEARKDLSKRFFILLYLFLTTQYEQIDLVFLRHHTTAEEVDEQEFFHGKKTGGTIVSSVLTLMNDIIKERYSPAEWNIFGAQASDGDNWGQDSARCKELFDNGLLSLTRYFAYIQVAEAEQDLWTTYKQIEAQNPGRFAAKKASTVDQIYPVFRQFFEKQAGVQGHTSKMSAMSALSEQQPVERELELVP